MSPVNPTDWKSIIAGDAVGAADGGWTEVRSPATGELVGRGRGRST